MNCELHSPFSDMLPKTNKACHPLLSTLSTEGQIVFASGKMLDILRIWTCCNVFSCVTKFGKSFSIKIQVAMPRSGSGQRRREGCIGHTKCKDLCKFTQELTPSYNLSPKHLTHLILVIKLRASFKLCRLRSVFQLHQNSWSQHWMNKWMNGYGCAPPKLHKNIQQSSFASKVRDYSSCFNGNMQNEHISWTDLYIKSHEHMEHVFIVSACDIFSKSKKKKSLHSTTLTQGILGKRFWNQNTKCHGYLW